MKKVAALILFFISVLLCKAQTNNTFPALDKSPMDMCYYPSNYPVLKIQDKATEPVLARVIYSRPQKNGRIIFGDLIEYGKVWRMGANEATEIEFYKNVKIDGKKIAKGRYTLYAIPNPDNWTIILNSDIDTWGAFKYDAQKDVLRTTVAVQKLNESVESLSMAFEKIDNGCNLVIAWDNIKTSLPIFIK
ncbi:MAG TPA: DUF2911 domain-containing protein [Chitinophagaceae bacterium]|nr:DUF2911 domain-containing protein [Chitinophagaceae bacterium]